MKQTTIRMHMNPEEALGTVGHVIDKDLRNKEAHINPNGDFEVWVNKGVYGVYKEVFGEVIEEYNRKQKRKDRRITDAEGDEITGYIKSIKDSKRGKLKKTVEKKRDDGTIERIEIVQDNGQRVLYELVISAGNCNKLTDEHGRIVYTDDGHEIHPYRMEKEINKRAMRRFLEEFETLYPNLKVAICAYHGDEQYLNARGNYEWGIEHIHLNFIPVASGYTRGLSKQASISKALEQMGFKSRVDEYGVYRNAYCQFCMDAQNRFENILDNEYYKYYMNDRHMRFEDIEELEIIHPAQGKGKRNLDPDVYKTLKELENRKLAVNADLSEIQEQKQVVEEEVVEAKKRLKKANKEAENVLLDACVVADENVASVEADVIQRRLEMDEELVSMQLELLVTEQKAREYYEEKMRQADEDFDEAVQNAKELEKEANRYIDRCYQEYNSDFDKCKRLLRNIKKDISGMEKEVEKISKEDVQVSITDELQEYLMNYCVVVNGEKVTLLDDFTEQLNKKRRKRNGSVNGSIKKMQERVSDRLEGIDDYQKFLQMRCCDDFTEELEQ